jgi:ankyrin repeat protein
MCEWSERDALYWACRHKLKGIYPMLLMDIAKVIRSKNAGPRCTTLDIMFASIQDYETVVNAKQITESRIAQLYDLPVEQVKIINYPVAMALKIVLPRKIMAGDPGDRDVYGAQQHARLFRIEI